MFRHSPPEHLSAWLHPVLGIHQWIRQAQLALLELNFGAERMMEDKSIGSIPFQCVTHDIKQNDVTKAYENGLHLSSTSQRCSLQFSKWVRDLENWGREGTVRTANQAFSLQRWGQKSCSGRQRITTSLSPNMKIHTRLVRISWYTLSL